MQKFILPTKKEIAAIIGYFAAATYAAIQLGGF